MLSEISTDATETPAQDSLLRWRQATLDGNDAFRSGHYEQAIGHYDLALTMADTLFGQIDDADAGMAAYVIAHHNLADTYDRLGNPSLRRLHLCLPHDTLCAAMNDRVLPEQWQVAAQNHSRRTYTELTRYLSDHPDDIEARRVSNQGAAGMTHGVSVQ